MSRTNKNKSLLHLRVLRLPSLTRQAGHGASGGTGPRRVGRGGRAGRALAGEGPLQQTGRFEAGGRSWPGIGRLLPASRSGRGAGEGGGSAGRRLLRLGLGLRGAVGWERRPAGASGQFRGFLGTGHGHRPAARLVGERRRGGGRGAIGDDGRRCAAKRGRHRGTSGAARPLCEAALGGDAFRLYGGRRRGARPLLLQSRAFFRFRLRFCCRFRLPHREIRLAVRVLAESEEEAKASKEKEG